MKLGGVLVAAVAMSIFCNHPLNAAQEWWPDKAKTNQFIQEFADFYYAQTSPGQIQLLFSEPVDKTLEDWDGEEYKAVVLSEIPVGFSSFENPMAVSESFFSDYNRRENQCLIVMVKQNFESFRHRILEPMVDSIRGLSLEQAFYSVIVHELTHCFEKFEIHSVLQNASIKGWPRGRGVKQVVFKEALADIMQTLFLIQATGEKQAARKFMYQVRSSRAKKDPKHDTSQALEKPYFEILPPEEHWLEWSYNLRERAFPKGTKSLFVPRRI